VFLFSRRALPGAFFSLPSLIAGMDNVNSLYGGRMHVSAPTVHKQGICHARIVSPTHAFERNVHVSAQTGFTLPRIGSDLEEVAGCLSGLVSWNFYNLLTTHN
jgi:hypothetical protein